MPQEKRKAALAGVRRIVIKIGSSVLSGPDDRIDSDRIHLICDQVHALKSRGCTVVVVTSGAIGAGMGQLSLRARPTALPKLQAAAAVGQCKLISIYDEAFAVHGYHAAQMLLTREDFEERTRYVNARNTLWALLEMDAVPVINENDTIAIDELKFGDNDIISSLVTHLLQADLLILLSDVDGLYEMKGKRKTGKLLDVVEGMNEGILSLASDMRSKFGSGGMQSKLMAVQRALDAGEPAIIANGAIPDILLKLMDGEPLGTLFLPSARRMKSWKRWIGFAARPKGHIQVDDGARNALADGGKSLLASGIANIKGRFGKGDVVIIEDTSGSPFARGLSNYSSEDMEKIKGRHTREFKKILGGSTFEAVVHRNNLVVLS